MDLIPQAGLAHRRYETLFWPNAQGHGIGRLLRFGSSLPAEIALFIDMETGHVVTRRLKPGVDGARLQRCCSLLQFPATDSPGNAVAFRRSDNQLTSLEEQGTPQQSDTDQMFDPATKALA